MNWEAYPRVTKILDMCHKPELVNWMVNSGPDLIVAKQQEATAKGNAVHDAIEQFITTGEYELDEIYQPYMEGFLRWWDSANPSDCVTELRLFSDLHEFQGRCDLVCTIDGERWIIDFKTSKKINPSYGLQLKAYQVAYQEMTEEYGLRMGILQLTDQIKRGYRFKEFDEDFGVFMAHKVLLDWTESFKPKAKETVEWELTDLQRQEA